LRALGKVVTPLLTRKVKSMSGLGAALSRAFVADVAHHQPNAIQRFLAAHAPGTAFTTPFLSPKNFKGAMGTTAPKNLKPSKRVLPLELQMGANFVVIRPGDGAVMLAHLRKGHVKLKLPQSSRKLGHKRLGIRFTPSTFAARIAPFVAHLPASRRDILLADPRFKQLFVNTNLVLHVKRSTLSPRVQAIVDDPRAELSPLRILPRNGAAPIHHVQLILSGPPDLLAPSTTFLDATAPRPTQMPACIGTDLNRVGPHALYMAPQYTGPGGRNTNARADKDANAYIHDEEILLSRRLKLLGARYHAVRAEIPKLQRAISKTRREASREFAASRTTRSQELGRKLHRQGIELGNLQRRKRRLHAEFKRETSRVVATVLAREHPLAIGYEALSFRPGQRHGRLATITQYMPKTAEVEAGFFLAQLYYRRHGVAFRTVPVAVNPFGTSSQPHHGCGGRVSRKMAINNRWQTDVAPCARGHLVNRHLNAAQSIAEMTCAHVHGGAAPP